MLPNKAPKEVDLLHTHTHTHTHIYICQYQPRKCEIFSQLKLDKLQAFALLKSK